MNAVIDQGDVVQAEQVPVAQVIADPVVRPLRSRRTPPPSGECEFLKLLLDPCVGFFQPCLPPGLDLPGDLRGVGDHEPERLPLLFEELLLRAVPVELQPQRSDHFLGVMVTPQGMRDDETQLFIDQLFEVQVGEHPPVPDEDHTAKGEPPLEILDHIDHGRLVRSVAGEDVMAQRDPFGRHHHSDDHLPFVEPLVPAVAVPPEVVFLQRPVSFEIGRGDVVEDQVQRGISGKESPGDQRLRLLLAVDQVVHRPKQLMVRRLFLIAVMDRIEPIQQRQFAPRFADPVDDQHPDQLGRGEDRLAIDARFYERIGQTQAIPNGSDRVDMAEVLDGAEGRCGGGCGDVFSLGAAQAEDQLLDLGFPQPFHGAKVRQDAGARRVPLGRIPERFDDLNVPVDLLPAFLLEGPDEHTTTIPSIPLLSSNISCMYVLHASRENAGNSTDFPSVILKSGGGECRS